MVSRERPVEALGLRDRLEVGPNAAILGEASTPAEHRHLVEQGSPQRASALQRHQHRTLLLLGERGRSRRRSSRGWYSPSGQRIRGSSERLGRRRPRPRRARPRIPSPRRVRGIGDVDPRGCRRLLRHPRRGGASRRPGLIPKRARRCRAGGLVTKGSMTAGAPGAPSPARTTPADPAAAREVGAADCPGVRSRGLIHRSWTSAPASTSRASGSSSSTCTAANTNRARRPPLQIACAVVPPPRTPLGRPPSNL